MSDIRTRQDMSDRDILFRILDRIEEQGEDTMAALDDLNAAVATLQTEQAAVQTAITDLVAEAAALETAVTGGDSAAIEAAVVNINAVSAALKAATAADPGPPPPSNNG